MGDLPEALKTVVIASLEGAEGCEQWRASIYAFTATWLVQRTSPHGGFGGWLFKVH